MRILSPVNSADEVRDLVEAGTNEFYCGYVPPEWLDKYGICYPLNRRPNMSLGNIRSQQELSRIIDYAHSLGTKVDVTINEHYYVNEQYALLKPLMEELNTLKVDSFIVADVGLILTMQKMNLPQKIIISGEGMVQNIQTAKFYKDLGASGIVFPREMAIDEIRHIVEEVPDIEYEVYILNERCRFNGGLCTPTHGVISDQNFCDSMKFMQSFSRIRDSNFLPIDEELKLKINAIYDSLGTAYAVFDKKTINWPFDCGCCAIKEFLDMKMDTIKIVGRGAPKSYKVAWVKMIRDALTLAAKCDTYDSFRKTIIELKGDRERCRLGVGCYYPIQT